MGFNYHEKMMSICQQSCTVRAAKPQTNPESLWISLCIWKNPGERTASLRTASLIRSARFFPKRKVWIVCQSLKSSELSLGVVDKIKEWALIDYLRAKSPSNNATKLLLALWRSRFCLPQNLQKSPSSHLFKYIKGIGNKKTHLLKNMNMPCWCPGVKGQNETTSRGLDKGFIRVYATLLGTQQARLKDKNSLWPSEPTAEGHSVLTQDTRSE